MNPFEMTTQPLEPAPNWSGTFRLRLPDKPGDERYTVHARNLRGLIHRRGDEHVLVVPLPAGGVLMVRDGEELSDAAAMQVVEALRVLGVITKVEA